MSLLGNLDDNLFKGDLAQLRFEFQDKLFELKDKIDTKSDIFSVYTKNEIDNKLDEINYIFNVYHDRARQLDYKIEELETKINTLLEYAALYKNFKK